MILVTGGTGLLGSHLLYRLASEHKELTALKRPSSDLEKVKQVFGYYTGDGDQTEELFGRIRWQDVDLMNRVEMGDAMQGAGQVYHCAAMVSFQPGDRKKMISFNTGITANVVDACLASCVDKLVHVSSTAAIGRSPDGSPATENLIWSRTKSSTGYAESKFSSEMEVWRGMEEGLNAVIVNPSIILGAGFWNRGSSEMFHRVAKGLKYASPGITGYVGVQDVVQAMTALMESNLYGERYILNEGNYSYTEIFTMIGRALGKERDLKQVGPTLLWNLARIDSVAALVRGARIFTTEHARAAFSEVRFSSDKIKRALGMEFTPLEQVIKDVAKQYLKDHA
jgi:nucleoside-diphosphate-sugar epimerase